MDCAWGVARWGVFIVSPQAENLLKAVDPAQGAEVAAVSL